jgi:hypothetical protein
LHGRILWELARENLGEGSGLRQITSEGECERRGIVHFDRRFGSSALAALCLAAAAFPNRSHTAVAASNKPARSRRPDFAIWTATAAIRLASFNWPEQAGERL